MRRHPSWLKTKVHGEALKPHTITTAPADAVLAVRRLASPNRAYLFSRRARFPALVDVLARLSLVTNLTVDAAYLGSQVSFARLCLLACSVRPEHLIHAAAGISRKGK